MMQRGVEMFKIGNSDRGGIEKEWHNYLIERSRTSLVRGREAMANEWAAFLARISIPKLINSDAGTVI
jgi:hypothetical protein